MRTRARRSRLSLLGASALAMTLGACTANYPVNPSFDITYADAAAAMRAMHEEPKPLPRPVVVATGYLDPGFATHAAAGWLRAIAADPAAIVPVTFFSVTTWAACRDRLIERVDAAFPSDDPVWTTEVDVVAISMGGLVARIAAMPWDEGDQKGRRLRIARLFCLATPHRGAPRAELPTLDERQLAMRRGSKWLKALNGATPDPPYETCCYVFLNDHVVGPQNAAPEGCTPWWLPAGPLQLGHMSACRDPRIALDIARRLRGEEPVTTDPPAPFPAH